MSSSPSTLVLLGSPDNSPNLSKLLAEGPLGWMEVDDARTFDQIVFHPTITAAVSIGMPVLLVFKTREHATAFVESFDQAVLVAAPLSTMM